MNVNLRSDEVGGEAQMFEVLSEYEDDYIDVGIEMNYITDGEEGDSLVESSTEPTTIPVSASATGSVQSASVTSSQCSTQTPCENNLFSLYLLIISK